MFVKMCRVHTLAVLGLVVACVEISAGVYDHYHEGRNEDGQDNHGYTLYLKPVLVKTTAPTRTMYLALQGKELVLYPAGVQYLPYPLQYQKEHYQDTERFQHPLERNSESEEEEDSYAENVETRSHGNSPSNNTRTEERPLRSEKSRSSRVALTTSKA